MGLIEYTRVDLGLHTPSMYGDRRGSYSTQGDHRGSHRTSRGRRRGSHSTGEWREFRDHLLDIIHKGRRVVYDGL